ncbi:MAG: hypothetical protein ACRD4K_04915 [Candidatus Acidiferrales bacterium]
MGFRKEIFELIGLNAVIVILSLLGIVADIWSRLLFNGIDGILLLSISLMMAGIFAFMIFMDLKTAGYIGSPGADSAAAKPAPAAKATAPAPAAAAPATPAAPAAKPETK